MRAAMLLIIVLAATISAHADKIYMLGVEVSVSYDNLETRSEPESCQVDMLIDDTSLDLIVGQTDFKGGQFVEGCDNPTRNEYIVYKATNTTMDGEPCEISLFHIDRIEGYDVCNLLIAYNNGTVIFYTVLVE